MTTRLAIPPQRLGLRSAQVRTGSAMSFAPGNSFTVSVHLQLAPRNTGQPPIPHIAMLPVVIQFEFNRYLSTG
ncbi:hypothetical protein SNOG_06370 [Parastagonospora nodorum SN15]|uniref:Uncharacterized protein n=1 Tax=Phaeosphaeria nodorum (strain SN15 / ATCC MYA-4574 / FGSC 10173) TaxID=321614 RepID=Q0UPE4_PHANO|nr:hypothetical protein SNOG_06370 [Parastagonospora nodorum SN15]EAT86201.1 hypothetical protein SNOG_06370 [Parastagonospora nodorum SN15]